MKIKELIENGIKTLKENEIEEANLKVRLLLSHVLNVEKSYLMINENEEINNEKEKLYDTYLLEIVKGKPIQYITNKQEFMGLTFYVDENVLIPQPDTEILVEETIKTIWNHWGIEKENTKERQKIDETIRVQAKEKQEDLKNIQKVVRILDLCTGSGAIAISIAKLLDTERLRKGRQNIKFEIYALDVSKKALEVAQKNVILNEIKNIHFILSDMFEQLKKDHHTKLEFDIIVSNPPYIETNTIKELSKEVQNEPCIALDGGKDGLDFYRIIATEAKEYLKENGNILLEIGYNQKESVTQLFEQEEYTQIECIKDLTGNDRVIKIK